ncbi:MAG TPA: DNA mismatch repair endonuclease MutL, partial [Syntrophales bacterium]|nr:DNA mismatch repair endonuclease MutL [Syntrophales bacterium]
MGIVHILPHDLINQIAAGEVIERPASVVKELLENAIDAGSDSISVEIAGGGIDLIRVADNGEGMAEDDLETAVKRHATSKIQDQRDLFSIHTLGFRGEALPSILSVSRAVVSTRPRHCAKGSSISIEAGMIVDRTPKGMPEGTVVEIRDLFYNTPARKKFLKTTATEQRHIVDIISRYAIAYPSKRFLLTVDKRCVLNFRQGSAPEERVKSVWGKGVDGKLRSFSHERPGLSIHGIVANPEESRPNRSGIYTYVNNRSVKDQILTSAIIQGFRGML